MEVECARAAVCPNEKHAKCSGSPRFSLGDFVRCTIVKGGRKELILTSWATTDDVTQGRIQQPSQEWAHSPFSSSFFPSLLLPLHFFFILLSQKMKEGLRGVSMYLRKVGGLDPLAPHVDPPLTSRFRYARRRRLGRRPWMLHYDEFKAFSSSLKKSSKISFLVSFLWWYIRCFHEKKG